MPTAITGNSAGHNPAVAMALTGPADTEGIDAADVNVPYQDIADAVQHYNEYGARTNASNTFTVADPIKFNASFTNLLSVIGSIFGGGAAPNGETRLFIGDGEWGLTWNASYADATDTWSHDAVGADSWLLAGDVANGLGLLYRAAGAGTWNTAGWTLKLRVNATNLVASALAASVTSLSASGAIASTGSSVSANTTVTAGTDVISTAGDVKASAGKLQAQGDPAADEARVECKQIVSTTASAPTGTKGAAMNNAGGDGSVTITGTDIAGAITVVTGAAVNPASGQLVTTVTLNKSYPSNPIVHIYPTNIATADLATQPACASTAGNTFTITIGASPLTGGGISYGWSYHILV